MTLLEASHVHKIAVQLMSGVTSKVFYELLGHLFSIGFDANGLVPTCASRYSPLLILQTCWSDGRFLVRRSLQ